MFRRLTIIPQRSQSTNPGDRSAGRSPVPNAKKYTYEEKLQEPFFKEAMLRLGYRKGDLLYEFPKQITDYRLERMRKEQFLKRKAKVQNEINLEVFRLTRQYNLMQLERAAS